MSVEPITVAVRDKDGKAAIFRVQHEEIPTHEEAIALTRQEFPEAQVILASVPTHPMQSEEKAA